MLADARIIKQDMDRESRENPNPSGPTETPPPPPSSPPVKLMTLNEMLARFQWSESCKTFFGKLASIAPDESRLPKTGLSARWCFFQLLIHGHEHPGYVTEDLAKASKLTVDDLATIGSDFSFSIPMLKGSPICLQTELAEILNAAGELGKRIGEDNGGKLDHIPAMRHLVAAFTFRITGDGRLLSYVNEGRPRKIEIEPLLSAYRGHLKDKEKNRDRSAEAQAVWNRAITVLNNALRGSQMRFSREASDQEGVLDVDRYAEALATLMRQADNKEFNLAIYGHWGRGKTYLMKRTMEALQKPPPDDPRKFETITFSAWQYPSRPEVWIHLYETFAKAAFGNGGIKSLPNIIRTGIARHGYWKLLWAYLLGAIALVPITTKAWLAKEIVWGFYTAVGLAGVLIAYAFYSAVTSTHKRLKAYYLSATRHSEKLGLQATIGDDLAALLRGWLPNGELGRGLHSAFFTVSLFAAGILFWRIQHSWTGQPPWIAAVPAALLFILSGVVCERLVPTKLQQKKVLLVVDDLDRCDPDHLLSVMESIKLLLENPEISRRVLVTMLIEEEILKHAIWRKYSHLANAEAGNALGTSFNGQRIARENCEKLFTVHLRLPPLEPEEIEAVVGKFAPREEPTRPLAPSEKQETSNSNTDPSAANAMGTKEETKAAKLYLDDDVTEAITRLAANEIILGEDERTAIAQQLRRRQDATNHIAPLGPRAIRAFIFRYQLTRLILAKRGITDWQPNIVIAALAQSLFQKTVPPQTLQGLSDEVEAVVRQVS